MQLTVQQPDLAQMFGQDSLYNTLYGMQRQDQASADQNQNLGQARQDQAFQADMHPLDMQTAMANIGHTQALTGNANAQTPGMVADSTMKTNAADIDTSTLEDKRSKVHADLAAGLTEAQARQHQAQAERDLFATLPNGAPDVKRRQDAHMVLDNMPAIVAKIREINAQGANEMGVARANNASRERIDEADRLAGKYDKYSAQSMMYQGFKGNFQQQAGAWGLKAMMDEQNGDTEGAAQAKQMQAAAIAADHDSKAAGAYTALAGKLGVGAMIGAGQVVDPSRVAPINPANNPGAVQNTTPLAPVNNKPIGLPKSGEIRNGYRFKGGSPGDKNNWEKV